MARMPTVPAINLTVPASICTAGTTSTLTLTYNGTNLNLTLTDAITLATWSQYLRDQYPATVGGNTAYVGFTGGTGGLTSSQKLTSWTYLAGPPAPNYPAGFDAGRHDPERRRRLERKQARLTDGNTNEARSAFFTTPVNVQQFTTSFQFQLTNPTADGFTFTIQGDGPTALGQLGRDLGYRRSLPQSVAVKFDLYNNAGEGTDSTGLYTDGATPTVPAINLPSTGINLHSGDIFNAQLTYNGTTLTVVITDTVDQRLGDPDLHRQYPRDRRRPDRLCRVYWRQRRFNARSRRS